MHKLLFVVDGNLLFITPIPYPILSVPTLLSYKALLAGLLGIMGSVDSRGIVLNLTKSFSVYTGMRESPGDIVVKDIKGT